MIITGDSLDRLKDLQDNSVDSVVTDPPYGLCFMNKHWDYDVPSVELWREVYRVLKPGGHVLSFGGTRTYHRLVVAIEDAGFEIRDQIQWLYGSGFPKSQDVSKQIDKQAGAKREVIGKKEYAGGHVQNSKESMGYGGNQEGADVRTITTPATDAAKQWSGWGTALKPANEPICVARKPLEKGLTVAANVLKWGTGAINIDETRVGTEVLPAQKAGQSTIGTFERYDMVTPERTGRWPANVILDEVAAAALDEQSGPCKSGGASSGRGYQNDYVGGKVLEKNKLESYRKDDGNGASRFFYVAKASKRERNAGLEGMPEKEKKTLGDYVNPSEGRTASKSGSAMQNFHPTVKPVKLMEYLITLVTPIGGTVLDPFMGSGTTGVAAAKLGFDFIGIELNPEYTQIAIKRIDQALEDQLMEQVQREELGVQLEFAAIC